MPEPKLLADLAPGLLAGFAGAAAVAALSLKAGWLADRRAAVAAALVGGCIFGFGGWQGAVLLLAFFLSASLLSHLPEAGGRHRAARRRAPRRTAVQVLANGGVAAAAAVVAGLTGATGARFALAGALAAATADTWATEVGTWWGGTPRSAATGRALAPGESGGMTPAGTFAAMVGAAWIGFVAAVVWPDVSPAGALRIEVAGFAGMWLDSFLGATVQFKAECPTCARVVEEVRHPHPTARRRGLVFLDNHAVNAVATVAGALAALWLAGQT